MGNTGNVPNHIKTNSQLYKYPHNYKNSYVKQQYLPDNIKDRQYYIPKNNKNERMLKEVMDKLKELWSSSFNHNNVFLLFLYFHLQLLQMNY